MVKSRVGPFALEAPLSPSRSTGQLFRGVHLEQSKLAALRVFKIPMGMTPESRQAYSEQIEQLKTLRHPGIVRCFGGGYDSSTAFLAYELIDGESLDNIIARRGRLPWETAFEYSQELIEALKYALERDWIHGRLKPDKILVDSEDKVRVCDWRRDEISDLLRSRPCIAQMQFTAPECFDGREADEKSELYSVGALLFFMLTGHPPFQAPSEQLRQVVFTQDAPDVRSIVLDCPVWFSSIVNQLLSRDPAKRPFSLTAVQLAFKEAQKRQEQGVGVLQHATAGFSPLQLEADRGEAEKVLGIKPKKRKKKKADVGFFDQAWVLGLGLLLAIGAIVWLLLPPSEATLYAKAERLLPPKSDRWLDWKRSKDILLNMTNRYPDGEHANWAKERIAWIEAGETTRRLQRQNRFNEREKWSDADLQYWNAQEFEKFGDLQTAKIRYEAVLSVYESDSEAASICYLASEAIQRIEEQGSSESELRSYIKEKLAEASQAYDEARIVAARELWESIVELYSSNDELTEEVGEAELRLEELKSR
ncbi:MAG: serine/threonine-protein kinase [Planctomycetota bacterium]